MKAMVIEKFGGPEQLRLKEIPSPSPAANEVQIKIYYAAVNPVDWKICEGYLKDRMENEFPITLGWDAAGVVSAVGPNVKNFHIGDEVYAYCRKPKVHDGTYAEYICLNVDQVALKPSICTFAQAASIPLAGLTAWQSLFDLAKLKAGETVLIHAGAGGVGGFAIEFAKHAGAHVITTASQNNHNYVKSLGADEVIDYRQKNFVEETKKIHPKGIDVVFDTVGQKTYLDSLEVLKPGGRIVSILERQAPKEAEQRKIQHYYLFVSPSSRQLEEIASLIEQGKVHSPTIEEFPLSEATLALQKIKQGHTQGKLVLRI